MSCPNCKSNRIKLNGTAFRLSGKIQRFRCLNCTLRFQENLISPTSEKNYLLHGIENVGILDIETSGLKGNFDYMITWVLWTWNIRSNKVTKKYDYLKPSDKIMYRKGKIFIRKDYRLTRNLLREMEKCQLIVGFFSDYFDVPFIRARSFKNKLQYPKYKKIRYLDLWRFARYHLSMNRKGLDSVALLVLGHNGKTKLEGDIWSSAHDGHLPSIKKVLEHNIKDVRLTYGIFKKFIDYIPISNKYL